MNLEEIKGMQARRDGSRLAELDVLRVAAILVVVVGHTISTAWSGDGGSIVLQDGAFWSSAFFHKQTIVAAWSQTFEMELFMALSGACYFLTEGRYGSLRDLYVRKLQRLMLPCFAAGLCFMLPVKLLAGFYGPDSFSWAVWSFVSGSEAYGHLWFLPALLWVFLFFRLGRWLLQEHWLVQAALAAVPYVLGLDVLREYFGTQLFYFSYGLYFWLWFTLGYLFQRFAWGRFFMPQAGLWFVGFLVLSFLGAYWRFLPAFPAAVAGCLMLYVLSVRLAACGVAERSWFGVLLRYNFLIYLLHDPWNYVAMTVANLTQLTLLPAGPYLYYFGLRLGGSLLGGLLTGMLFVRLRTVCPARFGQLTDHLSVMLREHAVLVGIVLLGLSVRWYLYLHSPYYTADGSMGNLGVDEQWYYLPAMQYILRHGVQAYLLDEISVIFPCGNPLYLALAAEVLGDNVQRLRQFGLVLSGIELVMLYTLARRLFSERAALLTCFLLAVDLPVAEYSYMLITENWFMFLLLLAGLVYLRAVEYGFSIGRVLLLAVCLFWGALTRSVLTLLPLALLVLYAGLHWRGINRHDCGCMLRGWLAVGLVFYALTGAMVWKNYQQFHTTVLASGSGTSLWLGSRMASYGDEPPYYGQPYEPGILTEIYAITDNRRQFYLDADAKLRTAAMETIRENKLRYLVLDVKKAARLTVGTNYSWFFPFGNSLAEYREQVHSLRLTLFKAGMILLYALVYVFGVRGMVRYRHSMLHFGVIGMALYFLVFSLPFLAILRYGMPIFLLVLPFAAQEFCLSSAAGRFRWLGTGLALVPFAYICLGL